MVQDPMNNPSQPVNRGWGWNREPWGAGCAWLIVICIVILIIAGWGWWGGGWNGRGWNGGWTNGSVNQAPQAGTPLNVTNNYYFGPGSDEFLGKTVTVKGKVDRVYDKQVFTLAPDAGGGHDLLVVTGSQGPELKAGETVEVTGNVEKFAPAEFGKTTKAELGKKQFAEFRERPAILATSIKPEEHPTGTKPASGS